MKKTVIIWLALVVTGTGLRAQDAREEALRQLQVDVVYLASDLLEGRETGRKGEEMAAAYIAGRLRQVGVQPGGADGGWYKSFDFRLGANPHTSEGGDLRTGRNVLGYIDNGAPQTVVIGAHYDHLGLGMPGSSLHAGGPAVHNGADDNASGVAALLFLAAYLKQSPATANNYLFLAFSGEELGLFGSKKFVEQPTIDLGKVNYMLNMDMVGRLNEEKVLAVNGAGTSPVWKEALGKVQVGGIRPKTSDSGVGPSDHTSFYLADIPVLHFFTGQHADYHKPSDDSELVNYEGLYDVALYIGRLVEALDGSGKIAFTKTKDESQQAASFKVTLGVMPDYVFDGVGMRIDAVLDGRPAQRGGLEKGDVILRIGDKQVDNIYDYMEGLSRYKQGDTTVVRFLRKGEALEREVQF